MQIFMKDLMGKTIVEPMDTIKTVKGKIPSNQQEKIFLEKQLEDGCTNVCLQHSKRERFAAETSQWCWEKDVILHSPKKN